MCLREVCWCVCVPCGAGGGVQTGFGSVCIPSMPWRGREGGLREGPVWWHSAPIYKLAVSAYFRHQDPALEQRKGTLGEHGPVAAGYPDTGLILPKHQAADVHCGDGEEYGRLAALIMKITDLIWK